MLYRFLRLALLLALVSAMEISVLAKGCVSPPTQGAQFAWPQWSLISVNIGTGFSKNQREAIRSVFDNWTMIAGSGVSFSLTNERRPISGLYTYQIDYMELPACPDGLETCQAAILGKTANGRRFSARTEVSLAVTDPLALQHVMSHEIGHTFGLDDCTECGTGTSAMNLPREINDTVSGRNSPGRCDMSAASLLYPDQLSAGLILNNEFMFDPFRKR